VQLLTYEDVSECITLTLSPRLLTNVLLKTRSHTRAHVFLTKTYLYPLFVSPYEAMGTRVRVRLRVRLSVRVRARVIEQSQVGNN